MRPTRTAEARALFLQGQVKAALRIAKTFRLGLTPEERAALVRGYECMVHPDFYRALGKDPGAEVERAIRVFREKILREGA